ncbi:response regulator [Clostridium sp.]|jgi:pilus assembly protein CpaE|uniref:response regulator n=1 Tax=Clostridium sp. TaxID=1506 RepID=UPI003EEB9322
MSKIKIIIADDIEETRNVIKKILTLENDFFEIVGEASNGEEVLKLIPNVKPDIILMDINMPVLNGLEATEKITNQFPAVTVIIMSVQAESEYLKKAMFHGAKEYIIKPFNYEVLVNTILTTYEKYKNKAINAANFEENQRTAKIITYFSSKGGVGKSILALNSAVALSREYHKRTLLIDLDLQFGDISMLVNKYSEKTILDVIEDGQLDSYDNIKPYLHKFNENLDILFAPVKPEAAEYIGKDSIEKMMKTLKKQYDVIIIDTGINFNDSTLYILDLSEIVLFVATMEIVALKNTKLGLGVMRSLGYDENKVKLIINNFTTKYGISKVEVEGAFRDGIFAMIPEEQNTVSTSVNKGKPFCDSPKYDKLKIGKAIAIMCKELAM